MVNAYCTQTGYRPQDGNQPGPNQKVIKARAKHVSESWPKETPPLNKELQNAVLRGVIKQYPNTHRLVRIYTSSSFTDTREERNALIRSVYPDLRDFCRERGYELHIVDMRWGVRDEATDDHVTSELCLREIKLCQRLSTGPNFVTFLGQKYGFRPFPSRIDADEMTSLLECVKASSDVTILRTWFQKDDNAVPPQFVLQPIRQRLPDYADSANPSKQKVARDRWNQHFQRMQIALRQAAPECLIEEDALKYYFSVTEEEIQNGILEADNTRKTCFCFKRHLVGLQENSKSRLAQRFLDVGTGADSEASRLLTRLKKDLIPPSLSPRNIKEYKVSWSENGVDTGLDEHREYIEQLCCDYLEALTGMIELGIKERSQSQGMSPMTRELLEHLRLAKEKTTVFIGKQDIIQQIQEKCTGAKSRVLVVSGESGSGKTSLMAKIASLLPKWTDLDVPVLSRFLGTTASSSALKPLLTSLCEQLQCLGVQINEGNPLPTELRDLAMCFKEGLEKCEKRICLVLDSLDQLRDHGGDLRDWIPTQLPESVILVLSTDPSPTFNTIPTLKSFLPKDSFVNIPPFDNDDNGTAIETWFDKANRTLQPDQMQFLITACSRVALPLYTRIAFETAVKWRSNTPSSELVIGASLDEAINMLLQRVERNHGERLVKRALGYITAAKSGLSEAELEDVLSLDDDVLNDVYQYHMPPLRRLPPFLWVRIHADLESYLTSSGADGIVVMRWFHRQFVEVARQRYLSEEETRNVIHDILAEYFLGIYSNGLEKLFTDRKGNEGVASRYVESQPVVFGDKPSNVFDPDMVNLRKLSELPYHLIKLRDLDVLKSEALLSFEFLFAKITAVSYDSVMEDFEMVKEAECWDEEMEMVEKCLRFARDALLLDPKHLPTYLLAGLKKCVKAAEHNFVTQLLREAASPFFTCLISTQGHMPVVGRPLVCKLTGHIEPICSFDTSHNNERLISVASDGTIREWDLRTGQQLKEIDTGTVRDYNRRRVTEARYLNDSRFVMTVGSGVHRWNLDTGLFVDKTEIPGLEEITEVFVHVDPASSEAVFLVGERLVCISTNTMKTVMKLKTDARSPLKDDSLPVSDYLSGHGGDVVFHRAGSSRVYILNLTTYKKSKKLESYEMYSKKAAQTRLARFAVDSSGLLGILHFSPGLRNEAQGMEIRLDVVDLKTAQLVHSFKDSTTGHALGTEKLLAVGDRTFAAAIPSDRGSAEVVLANVDNDTVETAMDLASTSIQKWKSTNDGRVVILYESDPVVLEYHDLGVAKELAGNHDDKKEDEPEAGAMIRVIPDTGSRYALFYRKDDRLAVWDLANRKTVRTAVGIVSMQKTVNLEPTVLAGVYGREGKLEVYDLLTGDIILSYSRLLYISPDYNIRVGISCDKDLVIIGPRSYMVSGIDVPSGRVKWTIAADVRDKMSGLYVCDDGSIALCEVARMPEKAGQDTTYCKLFAFDLKEKTRLPDIKYETSAGTGAMIADSLTATLTPDGSYFITTYYSQDGIGVLIWNVREGTSSNLKMEEDVSHVAYSRITDCIILAGCQGGLSLYRLNDCSPAGQIGGLDIAISQLWLSPDGTYCATNDPTMPSDLHIIDIVKKKKLMTYRSNSEVTGCLFADHNKFLLLSVKGTSGAVQYYLHPGGQNENDKMCAEERRLATLSKHSNLFGAFKHFNFAQDAQETM